MGEARLSISATFRTPAKAEVARARLSALLEEDAETLWQNSRYTQSASDFWALIRERCPLSCEVLAVSQCYDHRIQGMAPALDHANYSDALCGTVDWCDSVFEGEKRLPEQPQVEGCELRYVAVTWYWAAWEGLARWLIGCGATTVEWTSAHGSFRIRASSKVVERVQSQPQGSFS